MLSIATGGAESSTGPASIDRPCQALVENQDGQIVPGIGQTKVEEILTDPQLKAIRWEPVSDFDRHLLPF